MLKNYKELKVWQKYYQFCLEIYRITKRFPKEERYGLTSQIRRAAVSVPSNIAEGHGRKTTPEYIRFLYIAYGSNCELETHILLSGDLGYIETGKLEILLDGIGEVDPPEAEKHLLNRWKESTRPLESLNPRTLCIN